MMDGTTAWQRFRAVTLPALKPTMFLVFTLGLIGTWQVFDQVYMMSQGQPAKTTLTPAYLSYQTSFLTGEMGPGRGHRFHSVRHHRDVQPGAAVRHAGPQDAAPASPRRHLGGQMTTTVSGRPLAGPVERPRPASPERPAAGAG